MLISSAAQMLNAPASGAVPDGAVAHANYLTGVYFAGGGLVDAADIIDQPELIGVSGLAVPNGGPAGIFILGDFLAALTSGDWTLVLEYEQISGRTIPLVIADDDMGVWTEFVGFERGSGTGYPSAYDDNGSDGRSIVDFTAGLSAGIHRFAVTRTDAKLAMSVDGQAVVSDTATSFAFAALAFATYGCFPGDTTAGGCNIRLHTVYAAMADAALPGLSAV